MNLLIDMNLSPGWVKQITAAHYAVQMNFERENLLLPRKKITVSARGEQAGKYLLTTKTSR